MNPPCKIFDTQGDVNGGFGGRYQSIIFAENNARWIQQQVTL
jgi:hypothetical protein